MKYFFILGSNPVLSAAEIIALLPGRDFTVSELYKQAMIIETSHTSELDPAWMMGRLGGTIKIGKIIEEDIPVTPENLELIMLTALSDRVVNVGNATYGYSVYSMDAKKATTKSAIVSGQLRNVGMMVKKKLKAAGCAARWVKAQQGPSLSSVAVAKNKLIIDGAEFCIFAKEGKMMVGKTDVVQPFEDFSKVDYGRPDRDLKQGMLPPKLARMMINLIHSSKAVWDITVIDPFCGSGTVITEAMRMGFDRLYGSDLNPDAVAATEKNIAWVKDQGLTHRNTDHVQVFESDVRKLSDHIKRGELDAVVTEPYLGPPRKGRETRGEMQKTLHELTELYTEALREMRPLLKKDAPIVMAFPVYIHGLEKHGINIKQFEELGYKTESLLPPFMIERMGTKETKNKGLMYGRLDQHVWREIVRLRPIED